MIRRSIRRSRFPTRPRSRGANSIEFTVTLDQAAGLDASVDWNLSLGTATAGEDYVVVSGTLNFPAGSTTATIDVPLIDDLVVEDSETFTVTLSNPVNVRLMENAVETPEISAYGTIEDNDEPSTEVAVSLSIHEVAESAGIRGGIVAVSASLNNAAFAQGYRAGGSCRRRYGTGTGRLCKA